MYHSAQAFHGTFENFVAWLRTTERKIQRDDPLKLEEEELKTGLKHLKVSVLAFHGRGKREKEQVNEEEGKERIT